jgi:hypothetical protein
VRLAAEEACLLAVFRTLPSQGKFRVLLQAATLDVEHRRDLAAPPRKRRAGLADVIPFQRRRSGGVTGRS